MLVYRFNKGSAAPYYLVTGRRHGNVAAELLAVASDPVTLRDTLISRIPGEWHTFDSYQLFQPGDELPFDCVSTAATDWSIYGPLEAFIDSAVTTLESIEVVA